MAFYQPAGERQLSAVFTGSLMLDFFSLSFDLDGLALADLKKVVDGE